MYPNITSNTDTKKDCSSHSNHERPDSSMTSQQQHADWNGEVIDEILKAYADLGYIGSSLRYYYYILLSKKKIWTKTSANYLSKITIQAREDAVIPWDAILDENRPTLGNVPRYYIKEDYVQTDIDNLTTDHLTYTLPRWHFQTNHVEVWLEKMALGRIFENTLEGLEVNIPVHRGYSSGGFLNKNQKKLKAIMRQGKKIIILYFGDWNPSGENIEQAMKERLHKFGLSQSTIDFHRIAVTPQQIDQYNLPTLPVKKTDTRAKKFIEKYGDKACELDAFLAYAPQQFKRLLVRSVTQYFDDNLYQQQLRLQQKERKAIRTLVKKKIKFLETD
jgi:hypothetical protein